MWLGLGRMSDACPCSPWLNYDSGWAVGKILFVIDSALVTVWVADPASRLSRTVETNCPARLNLPSLSTCTVDHLLDQEADIVLDHGRHLLEPREDIFVDQQTANP